MFYDLFCELCKKKGVSVTKATVEIGLSRTIGSAWKNRGLTPKGDTLTKIAEYFGVTTDYLLGSETEKAPTHKGERSVSDDDIKAAFFEGAEDLSKEEMDEMWDDARDYIQYKMAQRRRKKDG